MYHVWFLEPHNGRHYLDRSAPDAERWLVRGREWERLCDATHIALNASHRRPRTLFRVMSDMSHTPFAVYLAGREVRCSDVG